MVLERAIARSIARAGAGKSLSLDETAALMEARGPQLVELSAIAGSLRELGHGTTVTYSRKVFIPLTMLCRDHCHYCTFAKPPARLDAPYLTPEEALAIAEAGRRRGCKEALFTLGDRPEDRYDVAREWLTERGFRSTLEYVRAAAIRVIEETGLLPHLNPGVMSYEELARSRCSRYVTSTGDTDTCKRSSSRTSCRSRERPCATRRRRNRRSTSLRWRPRAS